MGKSSTRAKDKYNAENYDQVKIWVPKGGRARIDDAAAKAGLSRTAFVMEAIESKIKEQAG